ncbi:MAG: protein phosphatase 2C domain-containing protein [Gallionellaceae bacterium]|jgi:serine/threonine protein phosphatase PrpC
MNFSIYQSSHQGGRKYNQDCVAHAYTGQALLLILADGMGGHSHGELAAQITVKTYMQAFFDEAKPGISEPEEFLSRVMRKAHENIIQFAKDQKLLGNPGTTCIAALIQDGKVCWAHAGDSRVYFLRDHKVLAVTHDHSVVQHWADMGFISEEQMKTHPDRHRITNCLGGEGDMFFVESEPSRNLQQGDVLLLCSDGLWGPMKPDEISKSLMVKPLQTALEQLMDVALYREGEHADNTTAVVVRWGAAEPAHEGTETVYNALYPFEKT